MLNDECFLILGGAGLAGKQIAHRVAAHLAPRKIVIASLGDEVYPALQELQETHKDQSIEWAAEKGNIFVRQEYAFLPAGKLLEDAARRETLFADLFGKLEDAYERSHLVNLVRKHRPDIIIDSINTATAISYQDVYSASLETRKQIDSLLQDIQQENIIQVQSQSLRTERLIYELLLSQSMPELIRHVLLLHKVMVEVGTRMYLKIGTTGTGGMGLNVPYTHSEDKPSAKLITKSAVAFAHTGLLFLMARTAGGPIVKEIKPGGMIGYADVTCRPFKGHDKSGKLQDRFEYHTETLGKRLVLRQDEDEYQNLGTLMLPVVDTGENGLFTRGEFETITDLGQMQFVTPEEIAHEVVMEIRGSNTGRDVIAAIDGAVMNPTYRAGYLRPRVLEALTQLEEETDTHSVALGHLGPPELSKLLWEAELLKLVYKSLRQALAVTPEQISEQVYALLQSSQHEKMLQTIVSLGLPVLVPDGTRIIRGPYIRIPECTDCDIEVTASDIDTWAEKGWIDLRPRNFANWRRRFQEMERSRQHAYGKGSAAVTQEIYLYDDIQIGAVVGWIFNNEKDGDKLKYGYRIK
ncbi:MAG TPA: hypothetical protein VKV20_02540 [Ktedonobacteraceae bacterium]|jgi:hypothetical protein|nr:hypothetical protein [Ktedonobacteraceae bacterium]